MTSSSDVVHQLDFGLQRGNSSRVIGGTMPAPDAQVWLRRLQLFLRLPRFRGVLPSAPALSTFEFPDGYTAVVRRWVKVRTPDSNDAMALIGPSSRLSPPVILGLDQAFDWQQAVSRRPTSPWDAAQVQRLGDDAQRALQGRAQGGWVLLRHALARLLDASDRPLTIVGCPDEQCIPLLWGLHTLAAPLVEQHVRRSWTFSTFEGDDADSIPNLPSIVFLPERPVEPSIKHRKLIDLRVDQKVSGDSARTATRQVEAFLAERETTADLEEMRDPVSTPMPLADFRARREQARDDAGRPGLSSAVERILKASAADGLDAGLADLQSLSATPDDRTALRSLLGATGYVDLGRSVARLLPRQGDQRTFFVRLQTVVFGPDRCDLRDPAVPDFALDVLQSGPAATLGEVLLVDLKRVHEVETVCRQIALRWLKERGMTDSLRSTDTTSSTVDAHLLDEDAPLPGQLFISYAREDEQAAREIVTVLRAAGFTVWFDDDLRGGERWWSEILAKIRSSTVVVVVASDHARASKPCQLELRYVRALGLPIVPVRVGVLTGLRTWSIAQHQLVDFTAASNAATARLVSGVFAAARHWVPLPVSLPDEPAAPFGYLSEIRVELEQDDLPRPSQRRILDKLRDHLADESDEDVRGDICELLGVLANRPDAVRTTWQDVKTTLADEAERRDTKGR